jgi:hypothetical protein
VMHYLEGSDMVREERAKLAPGAPKGPMIPKKVAPYETLQAALLKAGPADEPLVARYRAVEAEVNACVSAFMAKGDPEWAKSEELIPLSDGSGTRDPRFVIADEACRAKRIEAAGAALLQQMNKTRDAGGAAYVAALKKRFK